MDFSERLKNERKKAGLSQKELAEKLGLNCRTYASYERGERDISTSLLINICKTLKVSADMLLGNPLGDTNEKTEKPPVTELRERLDDVCDVMPELEQRELLKYALYLRDKPEGEE